MKILRLCATVGLGLSMAIGAGCKSDSTPAKKDAGPADARRSDGPQANRDIASGTCEILGTTYPAGQSVTVDCVTYTCQSADTVATRGAPCVSDAAPGPLDVPVKRDSAAPGDTRAGEAGGPAIDGGASKDTQVGEAGSVKVDASAADTVGVINLDAPPVVPDDAAPATPDVAAVKADASPVETCKYDGQKYLAGGGVEFPCGACTCICDGSAIVVQVAGTCVSADAQ